MILCQHIETHFGQLGCKIILKYHCFGGLNLPHISRSIRLRNFSIDDTQKKQLGSCRINACDALERNLHFFARHFFLHRSVHVLNHSQPHLTIHIDLNQYFWQWLHIDQWLNFHHLGPRSRQKDCQKMHQNMPRVGPCNFQHQLHCWYQPQVAEKFESWDYSYHQGCSSTVLYCDSNPGLTN